MPLLAVFDVHDPAGPVPLGSFDTPSATPMDAVVSSNGAVAYLVTEGGGGLDILSLGEPDGAVAPELLGHLYIRHTQSIVLSADEQTVFVADPYENGLMAIDVREPSAPISVGRLPVQVFELALSPDGTTLAATTDTGVILVEVRDPGAPVLLSTFEGVRTTGDVVFSADGKTLVVADGPSGVKVIDIADKLAPRLLGVLDTPGGPMDVALKPDGSTAVVISESVSPCMTLVDVGHPPSLEPVDSPAAGVQRFLLRWTDRYPDHHEQLAWHATGGEVVVSSVDQAEHTAIVDWTPPVEGAEVPVFTVAVGNHHYYQLAYAPTP